MMCSDLIVIRSGKAVDYLAGKILRILQPYTSSSPRARMKDTMSARPVCDFMSLMT